jgi:hypothetical protein
MYKICIKCKIELSIDNFYKDVRKKDNLFSYCKKCHNNICITYHTKNKSQEYRNKYYYNKYKNDINYKLKRLLRARLRLALKNNQKSGSAVKDLGCSIPKLKTYLEKQFQKGMNWDNLSLKGWHIDHILPLANFDLTKKDEFLKACHYTNLQPLWARDNIIKSNK